MLSPMVWLKSASYLLPLTSWSITTTVTSCTSSSPPSCCNKKTTKYLFDQIQSDLLLLLTSYFKVEKGHSLKDSSSYFSVTSPLNLCRRHRTTNTSSNSTTATSFYSTTTVVFTAAVVTTATATATSQLLQPTKTDCSSTFKCLLVIFFILFFFTFFVLNLLYFISIVHKVLKLIDYWIEDTKNINVIFLIPVITGKLSEVKEEEKIKYSFILSESLRKEKKKSNSVDSKSEVKFKNRLKSEIELSCQDLIT